MFRYCAVSLFILCLLSVSSDVIGKMCIDAANDVIKMLNASNGVIDIMKFRHEQNHDYARCDKELLPPLVVASVDYERGRARAFVCAALLKPHSYCKYEVQVLAGSYDLDADLFIGKIQPALWPIAKVRVKGPGYVRDYAYSRTRKCFYDVVSGACVKSIPLLDYKYFYRVPRY